MPNINDICDDLYHGTNYPGVWHGFDGWGKASDFHEHAYFIAQLIKTLFGDQPINIVETGRCTGQSTNLFSAIATNNKGTFTSFDISDWNRRHIEHINQKYGSDPQYYKYITDTSLSAAKYLNSNTKINVLFLDSLHSYEHVKQETLVFEPYLADKHVILFHDTVWCFDSVMGWIVDYLADKQVSYCKHADTDKPQCLSCDKFSQPGLAHGRPYMIDGRPNFQSPYDLIEQSPHFNKLNYNSIACPYIPFEQKILESTGLVFTNIQANCGIGALVKLG